MPWDGTELRVAPVDDGVPGKGGLVKGGTGESVWPRSGTTTRACT